MGVWATIAEMNCRKEKERRDCKSELDSMVEESRYERVGNPQGRSRNRSVYWWTEETHILDFLGPPHSSVTICSATWSKLHKRSHYPMGLVKTTLPLQGTARHDLANCRTMQARKTQFMGFLV